MTHAPWHFSTCAAALVVALALPTWCTQAEGAEPPAATSQDGWVNISQTFFTKIGSYDIDPRVPYLRRCLGLIVTPTGDLVMQTATQGICVSRDQGATWAVVPDNGIAGRCEDGNGMSIAYPYDGRMAFFAYDGADGMSGGISLDGARTWKPFSQLKRGVQFGDVDWSTKDPQTVFAVTHEPFLTVLSVDGGKNWRQLDVDEDVGEANGWVGVIDANHLTRFNRHSGTIEWSEDAGVTWSQVAYFHVRGYRPVHYGPRLYWTTAKGVITSLDGKDWTLTGPGAEGACYGPYFGASDQEFVVVTDNAFLKTKDGGKSWKTLTGMYRAPDIFSAALTYYGWDAAHDILYASGLGASVFRFKVGTAP